MYIHIIVITIGRYSGYAYNIILLCTRINNNNIICLYTSADELQFLTRIRERWIDLCAFDFVCFRGGLRVRDQGSATTATSPSRTRIPNASSRTSIRVVNRTSTGKTATAVRPARATQSSTANRLRTGRLVHR